MTKCHPPCNDMEETMGPARKAKSVSFDHSHEADRADQSRTASTRDAVKPANDDTNVLRQARRLREEWRRNRYARLRSA
jgi:hypothetical protein